MATKIATKCYDRNAVIDRVAIEITIKFLDIIIANEEDRMKDDIKYINQIKQYREVVIKDKNNSKNIVQSTNLVQKSTTEKPVRRSARIASQTKKNYKF